MNCSYCGKTVTSLCFGELGLICVECHCNELQRNELLAAKIQASGLLLPQGQTLQAAQDNPFGETVDPSPVDFAALAAELRKARKTRQAILVEYMADKPKATVDDVARDVHDNRHTSEKTIRENARQTNDSLANLGAQLSFRVMSGCLFREISPK